MNQANLPDKLHHPKHFAFLKCWPSASCNPCHALCWLAPHYDTGGHVVLSSTCLSWADQVQQQNCQWIYKYKQNHYHFQPFIAARSSHDFKFCKCWAQGIWYSQQALEQSSAVGHTNSPKSLKSQIWWGGRGATCRHAPNCLSLLRYTYTYVHSWKYIAITCAAPISQTQHKSNTRVDFCSFMAHRHAYDSVAQGRLHHETPLTAFGCSTSSSCAWTPAIPAGRRRRRKQAYCDKEMWQQTQSLLHTLAERDNSTLLNCILTTPNTWAWIRLLPSQHY